MTDVNDFLEHYGVKGMKWGVSRAAGSVKSAVGRSKEKRAAVKAERTANSTMASAAGYSARQRRSDIDNIGKRATRKVEKRIADGESIGKARTKEYASATAKSVGLTMAFLATPVFIAMANQSAANLASNINAKRGAEAAAKLFADDKGLTSYNTVSLAYDAVSNTWK